MRTIGGTPRLATTSARRPPQTPTAEYSRVGTLDLTGGPSGRPGKPRAYDGQGRDRDAALLESQATEGQVPPVPSARPRVPRPARTTLARSAETGPSASADHAGRRCSTAALTAQPRGQYAVDLSPTTRRERAVPRSHH